MEQKEIENPEWIDKLIILTKKKEKVKPSLPKTNDKGKAD